MSTEVGHPEETPPGRPPGSLRKVLPEPGPRRILMVATFVDTIGGGMFLTSSVLYFTRVVHLPAERVGLGLTLAGLIGVLAGVPLGEIADRRGPREVKLILLVLLSLTMVGYVFVRGFLAFTLIAVFDLLVNTGANAVRGGLIRRIGGEGATAYRAKLRATTNAGVAVGGLLAAIAIQADTRLAYQVLIAGNAASFLISAAILYRLPHLQPLVRPSQEARWGRSVRDVPFNAWAIINGLMSIQYQVLLIPLPLWIVGHTHAPRWSVACCLLINATLCVLLQMRVGAKVTTIRQGGSAFRTAGFLFLTSSAALGLLSAVPGWAALLLVVVGCIVHTVGELWHSSGQFTVGYGLAPAYAQSEYQGMQSLWTSLLGYSLAPAFLTLLCIDGGRNGWFALGFFFAALGCAAVPVTRWADQSRANAARTANAP